MKPPVQFLGLSIHPYVICLVLAAVLSLLLFAMLCRKDALRKHTVWIFAPFAILLCIICARLFYFFTNLSFIWLNYGIGFLLTGGLHDFAISGAILGALLAVALTAKCTGQSSKAIRDALAPAGALMIALARLGEYFTGFGEGAYIESTALQFFPLAVVNEYGEWYAAIFMLEALLALCICIFLLLWKRPSQGDKGNMGLLLWGLTQIFCESFRSDCIKWGFVRVQQVFAAVLCLVIFCYYLFHLYRARLSRRSLVWRVIGFVVCIGLCIGVEFALDKSSIPPVLTYAVMVLAILGMGTLTIDGMYRSLPSRQDRER